MCALATLYKRARLDAETRSERLNLAHVERPTAGEHLGNDALAAYLGQVLLSKPVFRHQKTENINARGFGQPVMFPIVRLDKHTQRFNQSIAPIFRIVTSLVNDSVEALDRHVVFALVADGKQRFQRLGILTRFRLRVT